MEETEKLTVETAVRVLLVEDDRDDYLLTRELFGEMSGRPYVLDWVTDYESGLEAICRGEHDVYLLDYRLSGRNGIELLREAVAQNCNAPAIILTGQGELEIDVEAMKAGAADYLDKGKLSGPILERSIRYAMQNKRSQEDLEKRVAERTAELSSANETLRRAEDALKRSNDALEARVTERTNEISHVNQFLNTLLENLREGIVACNADGVLTLFNEATRKFHGLPQESVPAEDWAEHYDLFKADGVTPMAKDDIPLFRALRGEIVRDAEMVISPKNGGQRILMASGQAFHNDRGQTLGAVVSMHDITRRKKVEADLQRSNDELEDRVTERTAQLARAIARKAAMFETALDCIISIDHIGMITEFNAAAEITLGHRREDVIGRELADVIIPRKYRERHRQGLAHFIATGEGPILNKRMELTARRADGTEFPVELTVTLIPIEGPPQFTAFLRDITERKLLEDMQEASTKELRQLAADLSEADRRKNEFLAMLAHELRNPLAPIRNALQIMRIAGGDSTATAASEMMERQVGQLVRLVDDLLDVSRITRGKIELRTGRIELASAVNHAVEAARPAYENSGVELTVTLPQQPIYLEGDPTRLAQVVGNLLNNACKFTDKGGHIELVVERKDELSIIRVTDSGIGIAPEQLPYIFDMFVQADTSLERATSGLGIGLTLVKSLVDMHGGTVEARSDGLGQGSEFVVRLPILSEAEKPAAPSEPVIGMASAIPRRILVVDDNIDSAESLTLLLEITGHDVRMANDGLEAVEVAAVFRPEVILLDIGLPRLNGYEAAREIRQQPWGKNMTLIALTGWGQEEDRQRSKDAGFDGHMVKPVDHIELMKRLDGLGEPER